MNKTKKLPSIGKIPWRYPLLSTFKVLLLRPICFTVLILLVSGNKHSEAAIIKEYRQFEYKLKVKTKFGSLKINPKINSNSSFQPFVPDDSSFQNGVRFSCTFESSKISEGYEFIIPVNKEWPLYGLGEQYSHIGLNGKKTYILTEEQGIGRGDERLSRFTRLIGISGDEFSSYCPIPILYIGNQDALVIENLSYAEFDFTDENLIRIKVFDSQFSIHHFQAKNLPDLISLTTSRYGRMSHLPEWAYATCFGLQGGNKKVEEKLEKALQLDHPIGSVWIQDWVGRRKTRLGSQLNWQWQVDSLSYPDFRNWILKMNRKNIQVLGYINPFLAMKGPLTKIALQNNYLVKNSKRDPYLISTGGFKAYLLDLTNTEAIDWIKNIIKTSMIEVGMAGWMADFGEWLPPDALLHNGMKGWEYHNQYAVDWAKINRETIEESGRSDSLLFFNRSGSLYTSSWSTMLWCGDQMVNDGKNDGMPSAINALITSGLSGLQLNHADIGGYAGTDNFFIRIKRKEDLLKRWIEWSAFTPFFRTHEGLLPDKFAQVYSNDTIAQYFAGYGRIHYKLKPYLKQLSQEAEKLGYPFIRPLFFHYPDQKECYEQNYTYLLGEELLVVPEIKLNGQNTFYLPKGEWINLKSNSLLEGGIRIEKAGFGVYAKKGGPNEALFRTLFME